MVAPMPPPAAVVIARAAGPKQEAGIPVIAQLRQHIPSHVLHGQFLSRDCLEKMVRHCPPRTTITAAGYSSIDAYLHKESVYELLAAARFTESSDWMQRYLQNYRSLTPRDFTYQPVQFLLLEPQRWWK